MTAGKGKLISGKAGRGAGTGARRRRVGTQTGRAADFRIALAASLLAVSLHLVFLSHAGALWRDEVNLARFAAFDTLSETWQALQYDPFPFLSTLTLRAWTRGPWGGSDSAFRAFGSAVGAAILAAIWIAGRLTGSSGPCLSLALLGFSPILIRFGDSIRPYGPGLVFAILTFGLIWKAISTPRFAWYGAASICALLSVQSLFQNAFMVAGPCIGALAVSTRRRDLRTSAAALAIAALAALSLLPYHRALTLAQDWMVVNQASPTIGWIGGVFFEALASPGKWMPFVWCGLFAVAAAEGVLIQRRPVVPETRRDLALYSAVSMLAGTLLFLLFTLSSRLPSQPWYYLPLMALIAVCAEAIASCSHRGRTVRSALAILVIVGSLVFAWRGVRIRQTNVDLVASELARSAAQQDLILVNPWYFGVTFARYYRGDVQWVTIPPLDDTRIHRYDLLKQQMKAKNPIEPVLERIAGTLRTGGRVWAVGGLPTAAPGQRPPDLPPAPNPESGWNSDPYLAGWALQTGAFLSTHARTSQLVPVTCDSRINPLEEAFLQVWDGWR